MVKNQTKKKSQLRIPPRMENSRCDAILHFSLRVKMLVFILLYCLLSTDHANSPIVPNPCDLICGASLRAGQLLIITSTPT
jgi:hypothetical protein